jgi:hypothetical protein
MRIRRLARWFRRQPYRNLGAAERSERFSSHVQHTICYEREVIRERYEERGCLFAALMFVVSVPVAAVLAWAAIMVIGGIFGVFIDVDRAFAIIFYTSITIGPAFVAWRLWRPRTPGPNR